MGVRRLQPGGWLGPCHLTRTRGPLRRWHSQAVGGRPPSLTAGSSPQACWHVSTTQPGLLPPTLLPVHLRGPSFFLSAMVLHCGGGTESLRLESQGPAPGRVHASTQDTLGVQRAVRSGTAGPQLSDDAHRMKAPLQVADCPQPVLTAMMAGIWSLRVARPPTRSSLDASRDELQWPSLDETGFFWQ